MKLSKLRSLAVRHVVGPALVRSQSLAHQLRRSVRELRERPFPSPTLARPLQSSRQLRELVSLYYLEGRYAAGAQPVAWVTSGAPVEVLRALGYYVVYPENQAALCSARRLGGHLAEQAEQAGWSRDLCSYARIDLGTLLSGSSPMGVVPRPDLLVACTNICQTVLYWFRELARLTGAPLFVLDSPFVHGQVRHHVRLYVRDQLQQLSRLAGDVAHRTLRMDRLEETLHWSREAIRLWRAALEAGRARPAPWGAFDQFVFMAPIVLMRGLPATAHFYRKVGEELAQRTRAGEAAVRPERIRLLWDNLPVWYKLRRLSHTLADRGAALVGATYTYAWADGAEQLDESRPWISLADAYLQVYLNRDLEARRQLVVKLCRELAVDGIIFHGNRSCKPYSIGQQEIAQRVQDELGIRTLVLGADHADERSYSDEAVETRLEAFLETCR